MRTFAHFPDSAICPVCLTNEDKETILVAIDGTREGNIAEAQCVHLECSIPLQFNREMGILYTRVPQARNEAK